MLATALRVSLAVPVVALAVCVVGCEDDSETTVGVQAVRTNDSGDVEIEYALRGLSDRVSVTVEFSRDGGQTYSQASPTPGSDGTTGVPVGFTGTHTFTWDAWGDLGQHVNAFVRVTVEGGASDVFGPVDLDLWPPYDLDGDRTADVAVGAPTPTTTDPGSVRVLLGPISFQTGLPASNVTLQGEANGDQFGDSVAVGFLSGDRYPDLLVGAPGNDAAGNRAGRAYVFFGGPGIWDTTADVVFTAGAPEDYLGFRVRTGDLDGDGFDEAILGAPTGSNSTSSPGKVHVIQGGPTLADVDLSAGDTADATLVGEAGLDRFGKGISVGDVDGDLVADLVIGAQQSDAAGLDSGQAHVFLSGPSLQGRDLSSGDIADATYTGEASRDQFGFEVLATDLTGDGVAEVVVGAFQNDVGGSNAGRAYVFPGGPDLGDVDLSAGGTADLTFTGTSGDSLGNHLAAGDVDGDGRNDLLVGSPVASTETGRVDLFLGKGGLSSVDLSAGQTSDVVFWGEGGRFARVGAGDIDGDGIADILVGAPMKETSEDGAFYGFQGGPALSGVDLGAGDTADLTVLGGTSGMRLGTSHAP